MGRPRNQRTAGGGVLFPQGLIPAIKPVPVPKTSKPPPRRGFFYGPQIDFYTGFVRYNYDLDSSPLDGFGKNTISGIVLGTAANVPLSREYRFFAHAEFMPFPSFTEVDALYGSATGVTSMELELGIKYQYLPRISLDGSVETLSNRARFSGNYKEVSYKDDRIKLGLSFNF